MRRLRAFFVRFSGLLTPWRVERELRAELESHFQLHIDDNIRAGMAPEAARRHAILKFGPLESIKDAYRDRSRLPIVDALAGDVRHAFRTIRREPGFAAAAIATLALGIGANTAVFSVVDAVLLRPLPYAAPERIVQINTGGQLLVRFGPVLDVWPKEVAASPAFSAIGVHVAGAVNVGGSPAVRLRAAAVSPGFFEALGTRPMTGRTFSSHDHTTASRAVVIGHRLWRERLGSDPWAIGRTMTIDGSTFEIVGVMPPGVAFPEEAELWVPTNGGTQVMGMIPTPKLVARLADGISALDARAALLSAAGMKGEAEHVRVEILRDALVGGVRPVAMTVWIASALLLLVACINAANLLLARVGRRHREFAVRRALGASRGQLIRLVLIESLLLATLAAAVALPAAIWPLEAARSLLPATLHGSHAIAIDNRALAVAAAVAVLTTLGFGLAPAVAVRPAAAGVLLRSSVGTTASAVGRRFRSGLLVAEVAVALVLLAGAVSVAASVRSVLRVDLGIHGDNAVAMELSVPRTKYPSPERRREFFAALLHAVRAVPGVTAAGVGDQLPGRAAALRLAAPLSLDGESQSTERRFATSMTASPGFFEAAGIPLIAGRSFTDADTPGAPSVVVVSESFARTLGIDPAALVGRRLPAPRRAGDRGHEEIVGVVGDVRLDGPEAPIRTAVYAPHAVSPRTGLVHLVVRTHHDPYAAVPAIRTAVARIDPDLPLYNVKTFPDMRAALLAERRFAMQTMIAFAVLAVALATIGLYGVASYMVQLRTREIGIRLAVGATRPRICRQVLQTGALHALAGIALGVLAAFSLLAVAASRIRWIEQLDPGMVAALCAGVLLVAIAATLIPAWRAMRIDPSQTLRTD